MNMKTAIQHHVRIIFFLVIIATSIIPTYSQAADTDNEVPFQLSIMHTNDIHGHVERFPQLITASNEVRANHPDTLLLHAGDIFSGTLYFHMFHAQADLLFMNHMSYDAMGLGNHEFDLGRKEAGHPELVDFISSATFPVVASNINFTTDQGLSRVFKEGVHHEPEAGAMYEGIIKEVAGEKVGIFGIDTETTKNSSSPYYVSFQDELESAEKMVEQFEAEGVDKIIALTHIGFDVHPDARNDLSLAANVEGIDVIVGGHSHTILQEPYVVTENAAGEEMSPTVIVQAGEYGQYLGHVNVGFDENGDVIDYDGQLIDVTEKKPDPEAMEVLEPYAKQVDKVKNEKSGGVAMRDFPNPRVKSDGEGESVRNSETALGNLITDAMLHEAQAVDPQVSMAFMNGGSIRAPIEAGPITIGEIIEAQPFGNTLAVTALTGKEIKAVLEQSVKTAPRESGRFLHVSGLAYTYDHEAEVGSRIQSVQVKDGDNEMAIDDDQTYYVVTNNFLAYGGEGYDILASAYEQGRVKDLGLSDWEVLRDYVAELGEVDTTVEGRIIDVAK
ncbi:bifunctional metallophosphatase/5'-nucleotidase [Texcoconibacillus texcoconensis]|uniref:2',3'-cyclic-nucleotide 2'-phosphodiesterase (5'-nucleotidase family) n=1 Tax=Texcoconibacillus texcoconensis TaxID=1095777 RepID=A0A840QPU7_9BACI|nr:5'-nucleotidase C-terminal domain-containing protein [Texcoconibacillus texcoconensis]MBB5173390.1 2',3'-cyclic-nucleotide 2'-phosphodiesterase (5'-nucleotidase family) [Texcoconibacillus texcoconensis]